MNSDNVAGLQAQHKILEEKINTVCTDLKNRSEIDNIKNKLDDLAGFLRAHSEAEGKLMKSYRYHGLELHEREHQDLLNRLFLLRKNIYTSFKEEHKQALLSFLERDLMEHVIEDERTWQAGEINREFVYQRLQDYAYDSANDAVKTWQEGEIDREYLYQRLQDYALSSAHRKI